MRHVASIGISSRSVCSSVAMACLVVQGCSQAVPYSMRQTIEMGQFAFAVTSAEKGNTWQSSEGPFHEIVVRIRVERDDTKPYTTDFGWSFVDALRITDAAGNRIGCSPSAIDAEYLRGRYRSNYYRCLFRYSRSLDGVRDFEKIGTKPSDFQLVITNPEPKDGQPRQVTIQLE